MLICYTHLKYKIRNAWKWERIRTKTNLRMMELRNPFKNVEIALSSEKAKEGSSRLYQQSKRLNNIWKTRGVPGNLFTLTLCNNILDDRPLLGISQYVPWDGDIIPNKVKRVCVYGWAAVVQYFFDTHNTFLWSWWAHRAFYSFQEGSLVERSRSTLNSPCTFATN